MSSLEQCSNTKWCFNQHKQYNPQTNIGHCAGGGIGRADDSCAWDINLNYPQADSDAGKPVYAAASGVVCQTYGERANCGGSYGQILIEHQDRDSTWWSGYLHLGKIQVRPGQTVDTTTILGFISNTSPDSIPNHLHFGVYTGKNTLRGLVTFNAAIAPRPSPQQPSAQPTPAVPTPTSPGTGSEPGELIDTLTPTLQWTAVPGADYYALAISEYPYGSGNVRYASEKINGTSHTLPTGVLKPACKYRWNMQAHGPAGLSGVSATLYFQTKDQPTGVTVQTGSLPEKNRPVLVAAMEYVKRHEGYRSEADKDDTSGKWHVGWGLNLEDPSAYRRLKQVGADDASRLVQERKFSQVALDQSEADELFRLVVQDCLTQARQIWREVYRTQPQWGDFDKLPMDARIVAIDLLYQLGDSEFKNMAWYAFFPPFDETVVPRTYAGSAQRLEAHSDLARWRTQTGNNRVQDHVIKLRGLARSLDEAPTTATSDEEIPSDSSTPRSPTGKPTVVAENIPKTELPVPLMKQETRAGCARACAVMAIRCLCPDLSLQNAEKAIPDNAFITTVATGISTLTGGRLGGTYFSKNGQSWFDFTTESLKDGCPVIALVPDAQKLPGWNSTYSGGHYVVLCGVDSNSRITYSDPVDATRRHSASKEEFHGAWGGTHPDAKPWQGVLVRANMASSRTAAESNRPTENRASVVQPSQKPATPSVGGTKPGDGSAKAQAPAAEKPGEPARFRELSPQERAKAASLWGKAQAARKSMNMPWFGDLAKKNMVDHCRQLIKRFPDSEYAYKAKQALGKLSVKDRRRYGVTDQEISLVKGR